MPSGQPANPRETAARHRQAEIQRWTEQHRPDLEGRGQRAWSRARGETARDPEFRHWYAVLEGERKAERRGGVDRSPDGALARALVAFGYRRADAWYDVGDTDKFR